MDDISEIIEPSIPLRRGSESLQSDEDGSSYVSFDQPILPEELETFILQCPLLDPDIRDFLLAEDDEVGQSTHVSLRAEEYTEFLERVEEWSDNQTWLGADDWPIVLGSSVFLRLDDHISFTGRKRYKKEQLAQPGTFASLIVHAPCLSVLQRLREGNVGLESLHWREFEKLIAEMLEEDGYAVELGPGRKDGGIDVIAQKSIEPLGVVKSLWQAKRYSLENKVSLSAVRELADVRHESRATKGIIVTTSYLTRGALDRIRRDEFTLSKIDRDDLNRWIDRLLRGRF